LLELVPWHVTLALPPATLQRSILVDSPELGYVKGMMEIPAGATFELRVEVLDAKNREVKEAK